MKKWFIITLLLWLLIQTIVIIYFVDFPQRSDQGAYIKIAFDCFKSGEWYPRQEDIYSSYIWAPGLINYFILQLKLFNTLKFNMIFNVLMNFGIVYEIYWLGKKFFNEKTAYISGILWCLLYSNWMIVAPAGTEIPFLFLALTAFCLCFLPKKLYFLIAGTLFFLANWIRPLVIIFLAVSVFYMIWKKYNWRYYILLFLPFFLLLLFVGQSTKNKIGYFVYQSTTSGINLIMTSNDKAYGGVASSLGRDSTSTVFIKNASQYTFMQKDSIWKQRSLAWIIQHPLKYTRLYFLKLGGLFIEDSWSDRPLLGGDGFIDQTVMGNKTKREVVNRVLLMGGKSFVYYIILLFFFYSLLTHRKELFTSKGIIFLILLLGTLGTCLFSVSPRYHYPFFFVVVIWAAYGVETFIQKKKKEK